MPNDEENPRPAPKDSTGAEQFPEETSTINPQLPLEANSNSGNGGGRTAPAIQGDANGKLHQGRKRQRKPTLKQQRFAAAYVDPKGANGNGTLACGAAGYKGGNDQLAVQASKNLRNPKIQELISGTLDAMADRALQRLGEALDATTSRAFLDREGSLVYTDPAPDHRTRLAAVHSVFAIREKLQAIAVHDLGDFERTNDAGHAGDDYAGDEVGGNQLHESDQKLLDQAAAIEDELAELDSAEDGHDGYEHEE